MDINEMRRKYREKKEQEQNFQVANNENTNVKSGDCSTVTFSDDISYNYEQGSNSVSFSCSRLDNASDERTGMLSLNCWISDKKYENGNWQNDNHALADSVDLGVLEKGYGFPDINHTFEIPDNLLKIINQMNEDKAEWYFVFTVNEQHEDGNDYIIHTINGQNENEIITFPISDESITILKDSDENLTAYINDEEFTGVLFSSDGRFAIEFKDSVVLSLVGYHKNGKTGLITFQDSSGCGSCYYDENGNEIEEKVFDRKYKSEFEKAINAGFEELESRAIPDDKDDEDYEEEESSSYNNSSSIFPIVKAIIVDKLGVEPYDVVESASFADDLGADSLDIVEIIMEFEKEFNISIPDNKAENVRTVGEAVRLIRKMV